jgi:hypothetical protein
MKYAVPGRELLFSSKTGEFNALGAWYEMFPTAFVHPDKPLVGYAAYRPNDKMSVWSSMDWRDGRRHQWPGLTYFCNARTLSFYIGSWRPGKEEFWIPGQNRIYAFDPERAKPDEVPYPSGYSSKADAKQSGSDRFRFIDSNHLVLVQETKQRVALSVYNTDSNRWEFWEKALMKSNPPQSRLFSYWRYSNWQREKNSKRIIHSVSGWAILRIWSKEGIPGWDWVEVTDGILLGFDKGYIHAREDEWTVHEWGTHSQIGAVPYKEYLDPEIQPNDALEFCGDGPIFMKRSGAAKDAILFDLTSMAAVPLLKGIQKLETRSDPLWVYQIDRPQGREYRLYDRRDGSDSTIFTLPPMPK